MSSMEKQAACEGCRRSKVKCNRDGPSCARCRRLQQPCIQRFTSTTFVVRADNGAPVAPAPPAPMAGPLHSSSGSSTTTASASSSASSGPMPPPVPPPSLSRPAPSLGAAAGAGAGTGLGASLGKVEASPPLTIREELQLLQVGPRAVAEAVIASFLRHAGHIRRNGDVLTWSGTSPPPGSMPKPFPLLARWRHLLQYYSADFSWGVLGTVTAVFGDPSIVLPPPPLPNPAPGLPMDQQSFRAHLTMLSRGSPVTCYRGLQGCDDAPRPVFGADDEQTPLMLVAERGAQGAAVHVSAAFEELVMPAQALGQYINGTRCLPLYAAARVVVPEDLAEFADAAFQAMFLGDGNGMTSILSRIQTRRGTEERCLCRFRAVPPQAEGQPAFFALAFLPLNPSLAAIGASMAATAAAAAAAPASLPSLPPLPSLMPAAPLPAPPVQQQAEQLRHIQQQLQLPWPPTRMPTSTSAAAAATVTAVTTATAPGGPAAARAGIGAAAGAGGAGAGCGIGVGFGPEYWGGQRGERPGPFP